MAHSADHQLASALRLTPRGRILDLSADGWTIWVGSPIWGADNKDGP